MGKKGTNLRALEDELSVTIDICRDDNTMKVQGPAAGVHVAALRLRHFIEQNREVEEVLEGERFAVMIAIMGKSGDTIRALQKQLNISIRRVRTRMRNACFTTVRNIICFKRISVHGEY
jgi:transcription antitermination factor NusA-like protein